jgi:chemotaxis signal transduction protein
VSAALLLTCAGRELALDIRDVLEVVRTVAMARPPAGLAHAFGWFDWRGRMVPAFELAALLDWAPPRQLTEYVDGHLVITSDAAGPVGWVVERARLTGDAPDALTAQVTGWLDESARRQIAAGAASA